MNPPPNREVVIFNAALELPASDRDAYLQEACADDPALRRHIEDLLRVHEQAGAFMETPAPEAQAFPNEAGEQGATIGMTAAPSEKPGDHIGRYKLLQQIGEGGCGVVYMAEQEEPVRRRVALKVIKLGMDTRQVIARFEAERQALALMDHPNIAKVFDAGATDTGRPYFVMELIKGIPITRYCDENNLSTATRLGLFVQVCQAIQHAHQKGIIHRDIKPSNVLVADHDGVPVPKVIDFGIAKATTDQRLTDKTLFTAFEQFMGTAAYMSPEQARLSGLDIDTRSDIYSLGVLLYELLTGKTPFEAKRLLEAGLDEVRRIIREEEPPRPSTRLHTLDPAEQTEVAKHRQSAPPKLVHLIRGDLDWIVMKALEKDRARRYETANGLAMDLRRHLADEPVTAGPPSAGYKFRKFALRHRVALAVTATIVIVLVIVVAATGISRRETVRAAQAEALAKQRLTESETITRFLSGIFLGLARDGRSITVAETLAAAARKVETDLAKQPARRARLQEILGATYDALGLYREAIPLQEKVRDYYLTVVGPDQPAMLVPMRNLAMTYAEAGRRDEALKLRVQVLALTSKTAGPENYETIGEMNNLATAYEEVGRRDEAIKLREKVVALTPEDFPTGRRRAMNNLANAYYAVGRGREAIALLELERAHDPDPEDTETSLRLATWQTWFGQDADYETTRRRLVEQAEETAQAGTAERAAKAYCLRPSTNAALSAKVLNLAQRAVKLGNSDPNLPWYQLELGLAEYRNGNYAAAEWALIIAELTVGNDNPDIQGTARLFRAMCLFRQDRLGAARQLFCQEEAQMTPLPKDESKPFVDGKAVSHDVLIWWLAYKEARNVFDQPAAAEP